MFLTLAFGISWFAYLVRKATDLPAPVDETLRLVVKFGPSLGGLIAAIWIARLGGALDLLRRLLPSWRHWKWILFALLMPLLLMAIAIAIRGLFDPALLALDMSKANTIGLLFSGLIATRFFAGGGLGEELVWRGFMQPRLLKTMSPLETSLVIGVYHALWHFPAYGPGVILLAGFTIAMAIISTWMYQHTGGNLFAIALLHASGNATISSVDQLFPRLDNDVILVFVLIFLWLGFAVVLVQLGCLTRSNND